MLEREGFLDKLRVAATCAVVLLHTVMGVMGTADMGLYPLEKKVFLVVMDLICWCVPVFLIISGYLFLNPGRELSFRKMLTKYCKRIVLALLLFGVPYACIEQIAVERTFRPEMLGKSFIMVLKGQSWAHMWYLYLILVLYLLTPAMKWLLARTPRLALYALLGVLALGSSVLPFLAKLLGWGQPVTLPDYAIYFFYYIYGYLVATRKVPQIVEEVAKETADGGCCGEDSRRGHAEWVLPSAAAVLMAGMTASRLSGRYTLQMAYNYPFTVILALLLFGWGVCCERRRRGKRPEATGNARHEAAAEKNTGFLPCTAALTFTVYLVHPVFLNVFYKFLHVTPLSFNIWVSLPLFFMGTLALSFGTAWVLYRIPVLRKYVL